MPLQNRVLPDGSLVAINQRGLMMGNRGGRIHDPETRTLSRRRWASKAWICCVTEFKNRHRPVMGYSYTEMFFLDEVTALAAGHRPCFECRHSDAMAFANAFAQSRGWPERARAGAMDDILHAQRLSATPAEPLETCRTTFPDGTAFLKPETGKSADRRFIVLRRGEFLRWTADGYRPEEATETDNLLVRLTPLAMIEALRVGYEPEWHPSAN